MTATFALNDPSDMDETQFLTVPLEAHLADVLNDYIAEHWGELREKLVAAGMPADGDILRPPWQRAAVASDFALLGSLEEQRNAVADLVALVNRNAQAAQGNSAE